MNEGARQNEYQKKCPPPPHLLVKKALCFLFLLLFLALPVQSQTAAPTPPAILNNPTVMAPCGLPSSYARFTSTGVTTFNMTSDCIFNSWSVLPSSTFLFFSSGTFTINGNGYSIIGPSNTATLYVGGSASTVLNLNNVAIRQSALAVEVRSGARLNGNNVLFSGNEGGSLLWVRDNSQAQLENVWFLNNRNTANSGTNGSALTLSGGFFGSPTVRITNAIFQGNSGAPGVVIKDVSSTLEFNGCLTFSGNVQADGVTAATNYPSAGTTDSSTGACPAAGFSYWLSLTPAPTSASKKQKKTAAPRPSATARPPAVTCPALSQATGIAVHATYGLASGVQCQRLDGGGIGIQSIVEAGFIDAVDIWGYVEQGVEVCFPQAGRIVFLDARTMPRAMRPLESTSVNGMTCASISTPGSLVLMPS